MSNEGQKLTKADPDGSKRRSRKRAKMSEGPKRELGDWTIRVPPSVERKGELCDEQAAVSRKIRRHQAAIDSSADRHKQLKKREEAAIEKLEEERDQLVEEAEHGRADKVRCWRHEEGVEWVYTNADGEVLDREPAADGLQRRLVGNAAAPKPAGGWYDTTGTTRQCGSGGSNERRDLVVWLLSLPDPPEGPSRTGWPECEPSWHPRVWWCQERLLDEDDLLPPALPPLWPEDETKEVRQPTDEHRPDLDWKRIKLDGAAAHRAEVPGGEYRVERGAAANEGGSGKGLLVAAWAPTGGDRLDLPGVHAKVGDAKAEADRHWQSRLLWLGDPDSATQLDSTGRYQLQLMSQDAAAGDDLYRAEAVGMLGQPNEELTGSWVPIDEAKGACQDHADAGRWTR